MLLITLYEGTANETRPLSFFNYRKVSVVYYIVTANKTRSLSFFNYGRISFARERSKEASIELNSHDAQITTKLLNYSNTINR